MIASIPQVKDRGPSGFVLSREYHKLRLTVQEFELGTLRQITPTQLAEIERRFESVGNRKAGEYESGARFDASGIPDGTMIECVPTFIDAMAACIRRDGEMLNDDDFEQLLRDYGLSEK